jgi:hypothetical protein
VMAQIQPWYSIRQRDLNVYHNDDRCPLGKEIDSKYRKMGRRCRRGALSVLSWAPSF